ncbi:DUF397 domain-containing protein [Nocardiopsis gilva YIM 90087]|uniref:DUF397 domain-containing protein n=1 Tax=Nocardiopsis gilva YIM 90087 TaxID=1235441 RepID=A0A223S7B9_9ACTN|nr:DUF397 domain-containing protein [Nocardiopsis gilva]ASU84017.1 DUF397 domain-containing protein [Nocardiopsis gilva YIM 90087]
MRHTTGWFKSSYSAGGSNACVEVRISREGIDVRDSVNPTRSTLAFSDAEWRAFLTTVEDGRR